MASAWEGLSIAPTGSLLDAAPTWERLDTGVTGLRLVEVTIERGRSSEFEETGPGSITAIFNDRDGVLDPTNPTSPYLDQLISRPIAMAIRNPVTDEWFPLGRFHIDEAGYGLTKHQKKIETALVGTDLMDFLANFELFPGLGYPNAQLNAQGYVFYEDAPFDERCDAILEDTGLPTELTVVFSGNIVVAEGIYSPGDTAMQAIREAVDAEFPGVANIYIDKTGRVAIHGRFARFDPDGVAAGAGGAWPFTRWKAGDNAACRLDTDRAKMHPPFGFAEDRKMVRNAALAYPFTIEDRGQLGTFVVQDAASRLEHGTKTWLAERLLIAEATTTGNTPEEEAMLYSQIIIDNYAQPQPRISNFTIGTEHPTHDVFGPAAWEMLCGVDISDIVNVKITHPGGGGFNEVDFFVEGIRTTIRPGPGTLDDSFPFITTTLDLSPAAYWGFIET